MIRFFGSNLFVFFFYINEIARLSKKKAKRSKGVKKKEKKKKKLKRKTMNSSNWKPLFLSSTPLPGLLSEATVALFCHPEKD